MIKRISENKSKKEIELSDLKILEATLESRKEQLENLMEKIDAIEKKEDSVIYNGDDNLDHLEKELSSLISQRELTNLKEQYEKDTLEMVKMREQELREFEEELQKIDEELWKDYIKEELEEQKNDFKICINDMEKVKRLKKDIECNFVDKTELEIEKENLRTCIMDLEKKQELYRSYVAQKELYKCPSCEVSLRLIGENLELFDQESFFEGDIDNVSREINSLKRDISKLQRITQEKENKLSISEKFQKNIDEILSNYDYIQSLSSLKDDLEYLHMYHATQLQLEKSKKELESNIKNQNFSRTYNNFKLSTEKLGRKIDERKSMLIGALSETNEEKLRIIILKERDNKSLKERLSKEKNTLEAEKSKCMTILAKAEKNYLEKYQVKTEKEKIESEICSCNEQLKDLERKKIEHGKNLEIIDEWKEYQDSLKKYEIFEKKIKDLEVREKHDRSRYSGAMTLKEKILEAESIAIGNVIGSINTHAREYLDYFFEDSPISVQLQAFKETKKSTKPCINLEIEYKSMEVDINMVSTGELARIVIAFTLALAEIFNTPLLLLDECTANLDQNLTNDVFEGIRENFGGKLVVVIAHQITQGSFDKVISI